MDKGDNICKETKLTRFQCNYMIHLYSLPYTFFQSPLPSPHKEQDFTIPDKSLMSVCIVCVCKFDICFTYVV